MGEQAIIRLGLLGIGREYLDLLPTLYRNKQAKVVWVYGGDAAATVARLGSLFSFPSVENLSEEILAGVDLVIRPAREATEWSHELPENIRVLTDEELSDLRAQDGFRWSELFPVGGDDHQTDDSAGQATLPAVNEDEPSYGEDLSTPPVAAATLPTREEDEGEPSVISAAHPDLPELPSVLGSLVHAGNLGEWICRRLHNRCPGPETSLLLLQRGGVCIAAYRASGSVGADTMRVLRKLTGLLGRTGQASSGHPGGPARLGGLRPDDLAALGLPRNPVWALPWRLDTCLEACLLVSSRTEPQHIDNEPPQWLGTAQEALLSEHDALRALAHLTHQEHQARSWRRLRSICRELGLWGAPPSDQPDGNQDWGDG